AGDLLERLDIEVRRRPGRNQQEVAHGLLVSLAHRERLAKRAFEAGLEQEEALRENLDAARDRLVFGAMQRRELLARIEQDPDALKSFFARESGRFAGPLRLRIERLVVPLGRDSGAAMAELEAALDALAIGDVSLAQLAERVGGSVEEPVWKTLEDLRSEGGNARTRLAAVPVDGFARPVSNGREIEMVHVLDRSAPEVPSFESVLEEVKEAYLQANGVRLYEELVTERLQASGFRVVDANLALFAERATGLGD
ncbi:MAG: hypothetical protein O7A98_01345, partial [Acidobacteria bacterium]|nr:hypothetical protein [Acidobacteriota bacterium]